MIKLNKNTLISFVIAMTLLLTGCTLPGLTGPAKNTIKVGTFEMAESKVVGHMIRLLIERNTDLNVEMLENLGSAVTKHNAMIKGDLDISSTRFSGTDLAGTLEMELISDPVETLEIVQKEFDDQFDQTWYDSLGFENTYAFTVTEELAEKENLKTISDLDAIASELRLGVDSNWITRPGIGYEPFKEEYGFEFGKVFPMVIGLVYSAVHNNEMDVVLAYSTDGRLESFNLVTLEDDKQFFPPYDASIVARNEVLREHPKLDDVLKELVGTISTEEMRRMNHEADVLLKEPSIIAEEYLIETNYFE